MMVWEGQGQYINACEGLPWRKALALHLWYGSSPTASISEVMRDYNDAFKVCALIRTINPSILWWLDLNEIANEV